MALLIFVRISSFWDLVDLETVVALFNNFDFEVVSFGCGGFLGAVDITGVVVDFGNGKHTEIRYKVIVSHEEDTVFFFGVTNTLDFRWADLLPSRIVIFPFDLRFRFTPRVSEFTQTLVGTLEIDIVGSKESVGMTIDNTRN